MRDRTVRHQGEAICCDCDGPLGWTPQEIHPGTFYICKPCSNEALASGSMVRVEEFFGEWDIYTDDGQRIVVEADDDG